MTLYLTTILVFLANISLTFIIIQSIFACVYGLLLDAFSETIRSLIHADNRRQMVQCLSHLYHNCVSNHFMVIFYHKVCNIITKSTGKYFGGQFVLKIRLSRSSLAFSPRRLFFTTPRDIHSTSGPIFYSLFISKI